MLEKVSVAKEPTIHQKSSSNGVDSMSEADKITTPTTVSIEISEDFEYPLIRGIGDSIFFMHRMSKAKFRKMATALLQEMNREDELFKDADSASSSGSSPSPFNGPDGEEQNGSEKGNNLRPDETSKKSFLEEVALNTDSNNSEEICDSFREDSNDSKKMARIVEDGNELAISRDVSNNSEEICSSFREDSNDSKKMARIVEDENELETSRVVSCLESSTSGIATATNAAEDDQISLSGSNLEKSTVFSVACAPPKEVGSKLAEDTPIEQSPTRSEMDPGVTTVEVHCPPAAQTGQNIEEPEDVCDKSRKFTDFDSGSKNAKKDITDPLLQSLNNSKFADDAIVSESSKDMVCVEGSVRVDAKPNSMQDVGEEANSNCRQIPIISTGDLPESVWTEIESFAKVEAIPTTEIKCDLTVSGATKYLKLEMPNECLIIRISVDFPNVFVNAAKYKGDSGAPKATDALNISSLDSRADLNEKECSEDPGTSIRDGEKGVNFQVSEPNDVRDSRLQAKTGGIAETLQLMNLKFASECDSSNAAGPEPASELGCLESDSTSEEQEEDNKSQSDITAGNADSESGDCENSTSAVGASKPKTASELGDIKLSENEDKEEDSSAKFSSFDKLASDSSPERHSEEVSAAIGKKSEGKLVCNTSVVEIKIEKVCSPAEDMPPVVVPSGKTESVEHVDDEYSKRESLIFSPNSVACENYNTEKELEDQRVESENIEPENVLEESPRKLIPDASEIRVSLPDISSKVNDVMGLFSEDVNKDPPTEMSDVDTSEEADDEKASSPKKTPDVERRLVTQARIESSPLKTDASAKGVTEDVVKDMHDLSLEETSEPLQPLRNEPDEKTRSDSPEFDVVPSNQISEEKTIEDAEITLIEEVAFDKDSSPANESVSVSKNKGSEDDEESGFIQEVGSDEELLEDNNEEIEVEIEENSEEIGSPEEVESEVYDKVNGECGSSDELRASEVNQERVSPGNVDSEYEVIDEENNEECGSSGNVESDDGEDENVVRKRYLSEIVESSDEEDEGEINENIGLSASRVPTAKFQERRFSGISTEKESTSEKVEPANATSSTKSSPDTLETGREKKSRVPNLEDSSCEITESEIDDESFYIQTNVPEAHFVDEDEESRGSDQFSTTENDIVTEAASGGDTTENDDCKSVESLDADESPNFPKPGSRFRKRAATRTDEVDSAPTRSRRHLSKLAKEVIPEHSLATKSSKTKFPKISNGSSHEVASSSITPVRSLRGKSMDYVPNKEKPPLLTKKSSTLAPESSSEGTGAVARKKRAQTPELKLKTDIKVAVRSSPRKFTRAASIDSSTTPSVQSSRLAASTSKTSTSKTRSEAAFNVSTRRTKR